MSVRIASNDKSNFLRLQYELSFSGFRKKHKSACFQPLCPSPRRTKCMMHERCSSCRHWKQSEWDRERDMQGTEGIYCSIRSFDNLHSGPHSIPCALVCVGEKGEPGPRGVRPAGSCSAVCSPLHPFCYHFYSIVCFSNLMQSCNQNHKIALRLQVNIN